MKFPPDKPGSGTTDPDPMRPESDEAAPAAHRGSLADYRLAVRSREISAHARKEVQSGRAKFGSDGAGKELPQLAMARTFQDGDWRSGYYRDQTLMLALGLTDVRRFFAQIYAHADLEHEPVSSGRQMVAHFGSRSMDKFGQWKDLTSQPNSVVDVSPTAAQMPRLVGLAQASKLYRQAGFPNAGFSRQGNEVAFGTIGNGSTAEGHFWESINAIGILGAPAVISIFDDGYAISVTNKDLILGEDLTALLEGFRRRSGSGFNLFKVRGWSYPDLIGVYAEAAEAARRHHVPALVHVHELTQPFGHSTSGSHERYKSAERLEWEADHDPLTKMKEWMTSQGLATEQQLAELEDSESAWVQDEVQTAYQCYLDSFAEDRQVLTGLIEATAQTSQHREQIDETSGRLYRQNIVRPRGDMLEAAHQVLRLTRNEASDSRDDLVAWNNAARSRYQCVFSDQLLGEQALQVKGVGPAVSDAAPLLPGTEILNSYFRAVFAHEPRLLTFGEDVGQLGGVNQSLLGMQELFGVDRVADTGIREATILGQAIGLALRGLRPIAEIQYLDYLLYALQLMSDDLATLRWRSRGGQIAPVIVRTRGHRLEGVWHSGSPMGTILNSIRGMHVCVPRDMTRAVGFYNTLLEGNDPGLVVEVLNGYRRKESLPSNLTQMRVPLGVPEVLREGRDLTLVTYGALCHLAIDAADQLSELGINAEVIDVQTLLPFDRPQRIVKSLAKTNRLLIVDEDVPGGASAFMLQKVLVDQKGYEQLDGQPRTLTAQEHRPAYGGDGNFFCKPNVLDIIDTAREMMFESDPTAYGPLDT